MTRRKKIVATIHCATDLQKMSRIAEASGLTAEPADTTHQFHFINSGRILATELQPALWEQASARLDDAVAKGAIPAWSSIERA